MRATIIVESNVVLVDGQGRRVDCSPLIKDGIHAVQWYDVFGDVEYRAEFDAERKMLTQKPNETITDFSPYQIYVDQWAIENAKQEVIEAAQQKEREDNARVITDHKRHRDAMMKLPQHEIEKLMAVQQDKLLERAALEEQRRLAAWEKLPPDEQRQLIVDAGE